MKASKLISLAKKAGKSARSLSVALGRDFSYLGSMARRDAELDDAIVERAKAILRGDEVPSWPYQSKPISGERVSSAIQAVGGVDAIIEQLGVSRATVYKWSKGASSPRDEATARKLAESTNVSVDFLYGFGKDTPEKKPAPNVSKTVNESPQSGQRLVNVTLTAKAYEAVKNILELIDAGHVVREL